jgi:hypothetical protein
MKCLIILISVIFLGCSVREQDGPIDPYKIFPGPTVHKDFQKDYEDFLNLTVEYRINIVYELSQLSDISYGKVTRENVVGYCWSSAIRRRIAIKENTVFSPKVLRNLIYHELGHCLLDLDHMDDFPAIMNTNLMNPFDYDEKEWDAMVHELMDDAFKY